VSRYAQALEGSRRKYVRGNSGEDPRLCDDAFEELLEDARGMAARLVALEGRDQWILVSDRLPADGMLVECVIAAERHRWLVLRLQVYGPNGSAAFGRIPANRILCWRPARPVGELPIPGGER
jgi:hypothetical protein